MSVLFMSPVVTSRPDLAVRAAFLTDTFLSPSSRGSYSTGQKRLLSFDPFPINDVNVSLWFAELSMDVSANTMKACLSSVMKLAREPGFAVELAMESPIAKLLMGAASICHIIASEGISCSL